MKFTALKREHGFTLVELLIVIAIIGILSAALLAAINPLEQARKARDTARKVDAGQISRAITSYYANNGCLPWEGVPCTASGQTVAATRMISGGGGNFITTAVGSPGTFGAGRMLAGSAAELTATFPNKDSIRNGNLWISVNAPVANTISTVNVCFEPESAQARNSLNSNLGSLRNITNDAAGTLCGGAAYVGNSAGGNAATCWICVP